MEKKHLPECGMCSRFYKSTQQTRNRRTRLIEGILEELTANTVRMGKGRRLSTRHRSPLPVSVTLEALPWPSCEEEK
jgi:hypothetical protein